MGVEVLDRMTVVTQPDSPEIEVKPAVLCITNTSTTPTLRLRGGQQLVLDAEKAGPGGWSVRAGIETIVYTRSLDGWTYNVVPPD